MSLKLRHAPTSPYVRKAMVLAQETGLAPRIELVPTDVWSADTDIQTDNPLGKVPALATPDGTLCDSPLICEYLDGLHDGRRFVPEAGPARWRALRLEALGDGVLDAAVGTVIETLRRPADKVWDGNVQRQAGKIRAALDGLEREAAGFGALEDVGEITVACALGYLDFRLPELAWREGRPALAAWYETVAKRPSMTATAPGT
ncbi:Glutathione S-transferase [Tistlia consotensis]|uniref:Glutathione S-transferase n=1 Tax=Tistlia consotensis USBA 355 TaxID=560819 RepID=A0A1Y6B4Q6_9PROT|nr:glutathione S-transferase [Tistlia consotensis]SME91856.1 Glutathione S-transferase [Tistlia consotensis USBA 355]SNR27680.1 Glutathione S-transferase [Tistlia consotensis]